MFRNYDDDIWEWGDTQYHQQKDDGLLGYEIRPEKLRKQTQIYLSTREQNSRRLGFFICPVCGNEFPHCKGVAHEWLFKRSNNVADDITFSKENMIVLCTTGCHKNTKDVDELCLNFKLNHHDIYGWVGGLLKSGKIKHWPERLPREEL
ncbi:hypothetical protein ACFLXQ_01540 [Chloroflexota bacterium]